MIVFKSSKNRECLKHWALILLVPLLILAFSLLANASLVDEVENLKSVEVIQLKDKMGITWSYRSDDPALLDEVPEFPLPLATDEKHTSVCYAKNSSRLLEKLAEKQLELGLMIDTVKTYGRLNDNQIRELKTIPNCKPFRYYLHVLGRSLKGYKIISQNIESVKP